MALNEMIAQGAQFKMPDPLDQYGRIAQIQQAQNQNALAQYQLDSAQRGDAQQNALYKRLQDPTFNPNNPEHLASLAQFGTPGIGAMKSLTEAQNAALTGAKTQGDIQKQLRENFNSRLLDLSNNPSNANLTAHAEEIAADPNFPEAFKKTASRKFNELLGMSVEDRAKLLAMSGATIGERVSVRGQDLTAKTAAAGQAVTSRGQDLTASTAAAGQAVTARGQDIGAATAKAGQNVTLRGQNLVDAREKENIKLRQEDQRRAADPAFQQSLSQAKALGVNIAKDIVVRNAALPKVIDTAEMTLNEIDSLIGKRDNKGNLLKGQTPHPGFENAVGATFLPGLRFVPGTDAADFQTRFDQIKGGAFLQAFETLKGGGSITNVEGEKGTSALNRMQLAQSEKEFVTAAREFQGIIKTGVERAKKLAAQGAVARPGSSTPASAPDPLGIR